MAGRELLELELRIAAEGGPKPVEVIRALWGDEVAGETRSRASRCRRLPTGQPCDPLQVERLRRARTPGAPTLGDTPEPLPLLVATDGAAPAPANARDAGM